MTEPDVEEVDDFDPFADLEDRAHLERVADVRQVVEGTSTTPWASDPAWARQVVLSAKAEMAAKKAAEKPPIPAPEIPTRMASADDPVPKALLGMRKKAEEHGWTTRAVYGRGPWLGSRDRVEQQDVFTLGMRRAGILIKASWRKGKFDSGWIFSPYNREPGASWRAISSPNIKKELMTE